MNDNNSLAHTSWSFKHYTRFAKKYRRQAFYDKKR